MRAWAHAVMWESDTHILRLSLFNLSHSAAPLEIYTSHCDTPPASNTHTFTHTRTHTLHSHMKTLHSLLFFFFFFAVEKREPCREWGGKVEGQRGVGWSIWNNTHPSPISLLSLWSARQTCTHSQSWPPPPSTPAPLLFLMTSVWVMVLKKTPSGVCLCVRVVGVELVPSWRGD